MYFIYNFFLFLFLPLFPFYLIYKELKGKRYLFSFKERFFPSYGISDSDRKKILIHGVSVGEILTLEPLIKRFLEEKTYSLVISTITDTGYNMAKKRFVKYGVEILFFPYDFPFSVKRFLKSVNVEKIIIAETELWPNFLKIAKKMGKKIFIVNGRISEKSFKRYKLFKIFFKKVMENIDFLFVKSDEDAMRFEELGYSGKIDVVGNLKFDALFYGDIDKKFLSEIEKKLEGDFILIFGSVMEGEEKVLLELFYKLTQKNKNISLIFAPRHLERIKVVKEILNSLNISFFQRSELKNVSEKKKVMILDTFGELKSIYSVGDIVFIGGSLLPYGGHNPLEPMMWKKTVVVGPHMENFKEIFEVLSEGDGIISVKNLEELEEKILKLLEDENNLRSYGERGYMIIEKNRGVVDKIFGGITSN